MNGHSRALVTSMLLGAFAQQSFGNDSIQIRAKSGASSMVTVAPGTVVPYQIEGELSDANNEGLAMFAMDLRFTGGPLAQAGTPVSNPMLNFADPAGINNPAGFGGTVRAGKLVQAGGAQNTIKNLFAPKPLGTVIPGVALPGSPAELLGGSLTAPLLPGTYYLIPSNLMVNAISKGETGVPFWKVEAVERSVVTPLRVDVVSAAVGQGADVPPISITPGLAQSLYVDAGPGNAGRHFLLLGSLAGANPGTNPSGWTVPLNVNPRLRYTLASGILDANGRASSRYALPLHRNDRDMIGTRIHHVVHLFNPIEGVSNPIPVLLAP